MPYAAPSGWVIGKIFSEARYNKTPLIFDKKIDLLKRYLVEYSDYNDQKKETLIMRTSSIPPKTLTIQINRSAVDFEEPENVDYFITTCTSFYSDVFNTLSIDTIERFGIRVQCLFEMDLIKAEKYLVSKTNFQNMSDIGEPISSEITMKYMNSDKFINIVSNAATLQNMMIINNVSKTTTRKGLLVDIDYYIENINQRAINSHIVSSLDLFSKILERFNVNDI